MSTFKHLPLDEKLQQTIAKLGFTTPTQIQEESIPLILKGKDVIGESATGSGKTLAFGCGIVEHCEPKNNIQALVLVPTRELAEQVKGELSKVAKQKGLRLEAIYGGVSITPQMNGLKRANVVIATPGRMLDHINRQTIDLSHLKMLILDEADRMVEMGFIEDVEKIIKACPRQRQTLLFSATMYGPAVEIASKYMNKPEKVKATKMVDPEKLKQQFYDVPGKLKKELLVHLLGQEESDLVMVFCNTRRETEIVVSVLKENNIKSAAIHGGLNQPKRLRTIDLFHKGKINALVCTDVAARGLDIEGVTHIYNYDIPKETSDYVHRIGRTARAGTEGLVINLVANRDYDNFGRILQDHPEFAIEKKERPYLKAQNYHKKHLAKGEPKHFRDRKPQGRGRGGNRRNSGGPRGNSSRSSGGPRQHGSQRGGRVRSKSFSRNNE